MEDKRIQEIFTHLESLNIDLAYDPIQKGPKFLNKMVATCRNMTNAVQKYEREVAQENLLYERQLNVLEAEYEIKFNDLMTNDPEVSKQPSARDREAKVNNILRELRQEIQELKSSITDLKHVHTVVQSKLRELKDINRDIRLQIKLVEDEIQIGNAWGDQSPYSNQRIATEDVDLDSLLPSEPEYQPEEEEDYEKLFGEEEGGEEELSKAFDKISTEPLERTTLEEVLEGSVEPSPQVAVEQDIDLEDLLKDL